MGCPGWHKESDLKYDKLLKNYVRYSSQIRKSKTCSIKEESDKDFIKIRNICSIKDIVKRINKRSCDLGKYLQIYLLDRRLISRIYKELSKT